MWPLLVFTLAFGAWHWARLESPAVSVTDMAGLALLACAPAAAAELRSRAGLPVLAAVFVAAAGWTSGVWPWRSGVHYPGTLWAVVWHGTREWFNTHTPFDPARFAAVDVDVRLAFFALAVALAWAMIRRRAALSSIAVAFVIYAMPSTVVPIDAAGLRAALFLGLGLVVLGVVPARGRATRAPGASFGLGAVVVGAALLVSAVPGVSKAAFLNWHNWDPLSPPGRVVSVNYVWNESYQPLVWRGKVTPVLDVWSPSPEYWRVATLETFLSGRWIMSEQPLTGSGDQGEVTVPNGALAPNAQHAKTKNIITIRVKVLGLADNHLVGAAQPLAWIPPTDVRIALEDDESALAERNLARNTQYSMRTYAADPNPVQLIDAGTNFPQSLVSDLLVNGTVIPAWGSQPSLAGASATRPVTASLQRASDQVWQQSGAATAKYEWNAVADVEHYLRARPFVYDQRAVYSGSTPVLAQFLLTKHRGYCQMFSGAMAMVLRLHGIPSRVAVGFTTGTLTGSAGPYVVTDRDAHAWVEVYFPSFGWVPFDPTPGRHLPTKSSTSSAQVMNTLQKAFDAVPKPAQANTAFLLHKAASLKHTTKRGQNTNHPPIISADGSVQRHSTGPGFFTWVALLGAAIATAVAAVKFGLVRARYLRRGPRAVAAAAYHELATFVADQGIGADSSDTFEDIAGRVGRTFGVDADRFATAAGRARYASSAVAEAAEGDVRRELRELKRQLRSRLTTRDRVVGMFRLRSALAQSTTLD
jgi:Transglutaminase-like superfamily/TgpA N-terminal domain